MGKVQVDILGMSVNPNSQRAYALLLREIDGDRRLPIVIGESEAQAIANEIEGVRPQRPMTHDLLKNVIDALGAQVREVMISAIKDGTFYATILFEFSEIEVDARPSDAIALAVRCQVPIYVDEAVMNDEAIKASDIQEVEESEGSEPEDSSDQNALPVAPSEPMTLRQQLEQELDQAIKVEDYETAARIRDELGRLEN
ncbi:MAG: bifunctional nuclease domain-containing protein [Candidatus Kapaibacterium sp.]